MKEDLIADLWAAIVEAIPEKQRASTAANFVNTLMDYGIKETTLENLLGVDPYLDDAIDYVIDGAEIESEEEEDYGYNDDYDEE